jgi:hypothetical protein
LYIYHAVRILKISQKGKGSPGREITVGFQWGTSVEKMKLFDPENKVKDEMLGNLADIAMIMPVARVRLIEEPYKPSPVQVHDAPEIKDVISWFGMVKEIFVKDVWHEPAKYSHLLSIEFKMRETLVNVDDFTFDEARIGFGAKVNAPCICLLDVKNHFERQIENDLGWIKKIDESVASDPRPELNHNRLYSRARYYQDMAVSYLMLNDIDAGRKCLAGAAADYFHSRLTGAESEGHHVTWALRNAIMSGDREMMAKAASTAIGLEEKFGKQFFLFMKFMANIVLDDAAEAERIAALFEEWDRKSSPRTRRHFEGLATMCGGIVRKEPAALKEGLHRALQGHKRIIPSNGRIKDDSLVFFQVTDLLLLAKDRGLVIRQEDADPQYREYIPWALLE